ncbi:MAG: hypothetical protein J5I93_02115, partial [Pirellulaceae bacterium]|nr:hypothetical protein [Pirellulaceae bacterium]
MTMPKFVLWTLAIGALLVVPGTSVLGAKPASRSPQAAEPEARHVGLFEAIEAGDIDVKLIPQSSKGGNVVIENKTKQPLTIQLPEAFAGVPVLAQIGGIGGGLGGGGLGGGGLGGGGGQGLGGGFGGGGGRGGGGGGGGGGGFGRGAG